MKQTKTTLLVTLEVSVRASDERSVQEAIKTICTEGLHTELYQTGASGTFGIKAKRKPVSLERVYMDQRGAVVEGEVV